MSRFLEELRSRLRASVNIAPDRQTYFFKTEPGSYAAHDRFLGVRAPTLRELAKEFSDLSRDDMQALLESEFNEERQIALFILIAQYRKARGAAKEAACQFYMDNLHRVNNWNLVDSSARDILGDHLLKRDDRTILTRLADSPVLWERRVAIVATWSFIRKGDFEWTLRLAKHLLQDTHDLMHKSVGWMLREVGERDEQVLRTFLDQHASHMPRTMLRYAIEKFSPEDREYYRGKR